MKNTVLLLIDIQKGFNDPYWGKRNNPEFEENTKKLIRIARNKQWKVYLVQHCSTESQSPLRPNQPGCEFMDFISQNDEDKIIKKNVNSAFIGTNLEEELKKDQIKTVVISGLTTDHCVSTTTRMAANLGFKTILVTDAVATFDKKDMEGKIISADEVQRVNLASLKDEFAKLIKVNDLENLELDLQN